MHISSRVWLALSPEAREQYRNWFGNVDVDYEDKPRNAPVLGKQARKPVRRAANQ